MSGRFLGLENRTSAHGPDPLPWLRVFPPAVTFADVEANTAYTATVTLRNADTRPHVVKVIPPKTSRFAFAGKGGVTTTRLSPGLTASFDVTFTADEANDFFDACVIQTDAGETAVRLAARAPAPRMAVEGDLDFGVVSPGDALTRTVSVRNAGSAEAKIECTWDRRIDREVFRVEPRFATVEPGKAVELTAYLNPREPGDVSVDVDVAAAPRAFDADARRASATRLCATAVVVPRAPEFLTDAPDAEPLPMRAVDFGHVLCGDTRAVSGAVYNNSPYPATFAVKLRAEDKAARRDLGALVVTPSQGALRPYEKRRVTFTMRPALPPSAANENAAASAKGFKSTKNGTGSGAARRGDDGETTPPTRDVRLNATISFDANGPVKPLRLPVHARAVIAALAVDPPELDFGEIAARDRGDHLVTVRNLNDEMPVDFAFARGAFFKPEPSQGRVLPGQTVNVAIAYEPKALGAHADALAVRALGLAEASAGEGEKVTVFETSLMCRGSCRDAKFAMSGGISRAMPGGLTATPADFEKARKYVNPVDVAAQKETRRRERADTLARVGRSGTSTASTARRGSLVDPETAARYARDARDLNAKDAFTLDEAARRAAHREGYAAYIRSSRTARMRAADSAADDPADPTSLGLRTQYDLRKPKFGNPGLGAFGGSRAHSTDLGPALPRADEPLWIDPANAKANAAEATRGGARSEARRSANPNSANPKIPFSYLRPRNRPQQAVEAETSTSGGGPRTQHAPEPATAAQRRECARVLIPAEIAKLSAGPSRLDFGSVAGGSTHVKYFAFTNGTAQAVSARLELRRGTSVVSEAITATTCVSSVSELAPIEPSDECGVVSLRGGASTETRVVPAGDTAHFAIVLEALNGDEHRTPFKETVAYTVNDNPGTLFSFDVVAEVVPAALDLDCETKRFAFEKNDDASFSVTETIKISNPNGDPARFAWDVPSGCAFDVHPREGEVPGRSAAHVAVTWTPSEARREEKKNERTLEMYVAGDATPRALRCVGECGAPALGFAEKLLQFGFVPAGLPARRVVTLRNTGAHDAVFAVDDAHEARLEDVSVVAATRVTMEPRRGRVPAGGLFDVDVLYANPSAGKHRSHLVIHVRGGKTVRLPVSVDAIVPDVRVVERALRFGDVHVGSTATVAATLRNDSPVDATLCLDARSAPYLSASCPTDAWSPELYDDPPCAQMPRSEQNVLGLMGNRIVNALVARGSAVAAARRGWGEDKGGNRFKIRVAPNSQLRLLIAYNPKQAREPFEFFLPLYQEGVPVEELVPEDRVDLRECESRASLLAVRATARASEPRVRLTALASLAFGARVAAREGARKTEHVASFCLEHNGQEEGAIDWELGKPADPEGVFVSAFSFNPKRGTVRHGEKIEIACAFAPYDARTYRATVPVFLDAARFSGTEEPARGEGSKTKTPYLTLDVSGEGVRPRLDFDAREVTLAPTPPGVPTTRRFHLVNRGYANERVSHRLPSDTNKIDLRVSYPEGTQIGVARPSLPVDVTFVSPVPVSFTAAIDFLDEEGNRFCVPCSGVADNSALTLENFVDVNNARGEVDDRLVVQLAAAAAPVGASSALASAQAKFARRARKKETLPPDLAPVVLRDAASLKTPSPSEAERAGTDGAALALWLEATTPRGPFSREDLPSSLRARGGRVFVDLVEFWSGRTFLGKTLNASSDPRARAQQTLRQYEALLTHLKSCGATLAGVRPELLIDGDDFRRLARSYARQIEHGEVTHVEADRMRLWMALDVDPPGRARRGRLAAAAWRQAVMQAIKVFVLARVAPRKKRPASDAPSDVAGERTDDETQKPSTKTFDPRDPAGLTGSNAFNASEQILLRWLTKHRRSVFGADAPRVTNFGADLKDASVFYAAIAAHWPSVSQTHGTRMAFPRMANGDVRLTDAAAESNARVVLDALQTLRQKYADVADARVVITDASPSERVLFSLFLFQTLPTLIPKAVVSFACRLGAVTKRDVALTNPSDVAVAYRARLVGAETATKQFALEQSTVRLGPKQQAALRVLCSPTVSKAEEDANDVGDVSDATRTDDVSDASKKKPTARCFLVLSSARESSASGAAASTLVFALEASVDADAPVRSETFAARCYEMTTATVAVTNPFPADCEFAVTCVNLRRDDPRAAEAFAAMDAGDKENGTKTNARRKAKDVGTRNRRDTLVSVSRETRSKDGSVRKTLDADLVADALPRVRREKYPGAFGAERVAARVRGGAALTVDVAFLPFAMGAHVAHLIFEDVDHGRFVVELLGKADLPPPAATVRAEIEVRPQTFDVAVDHSNPPFERARRLFLEKHPGRADRAEAMKARHALDAWPAAIEYAALSNSAFVDVDETVRVARSALWRAPGADAADGDGTPRPPRLSDDAGSVTESASVVRPMQLGLTIRDAGTYPGVVVLGSIHDVRVVALEFAAGLKDERAILEFACAARGTVAQEIPLVNGGDRSMVVKASVTGPDASAFVGVGRDIVVAKGRRDTFPLAFKPSRPGAFHATLVLRTSGSGSGESGDAGESVAYALKGFAAPPEAESTMVIHAVARETCRKSFAVPNVFGRANKPVMYAVECDLDFVGGEPTCAAPKNGDAFYEMDLAPKKSGVFRGAVHFSAAGGHSVWFALEVRVARAQPEKIDGDITRDGDLVDLSGGDTERSTLRLRAPVRVAATARLTLANPLETPAVFRARCEGHGLLGAPTLTLPAKGSGAYEVTYSPLVAGTTRGSVSFTHDILGEFWYPATLVAEEAPVEEAPAAAASLGGAPALVKLRLRNPTDEPVELAVACDDVTGVFSVVDPTTRVLTLAPFEKGKITVAFTPSALDVPRVAEVSATSAEAGTWRWRVSGVGSAPSAPNAPTRVFVTLGQSGSHAVTFQNPFEHAVSITAALEQEARQGGEERFELLQSKASSRGVVVAARASHAFPFRFKPSAMRRAEATLVVTSAARETQKHKKPLAKPSARAPSLTWRFPIVGEAEAPMSGREHALFGKARRRAEMGMAVSLKGLEVLASDVVADAEGAGVPFAFEIAAPAGEREHLEKALRVTPLQRHVADARAPLHFHVSLRPSRELKCVVDLLVTVRSGGRWRFPIRVDAEEPEVDGVIRVQAHVGAPSVSAFSLPNPDVHATAFTAFFTPESPAAFSVAPETGEMAAGAPVDPRHAATSAAVSPGSLGLTAARRRFEVAGEAVGDGPGAELRIGYAPTEYGTDLVGRLRVVTKTNAWTFEVVGATPDYVAPSAPARVDTKISRETEALLEKAKRRNRELGNIVLKNTKPENYTSRRMLSKSRNGEAPSR